MTGRHRVTPRWDGDYNLYVRRNAWHPTYNQSYVQKLGIDVHSTWTTSSPGFTDYTNQNVSLTSSSPAREAGIDLFERFGFELPGGYTDKNTYPGGRPHVGALAYGKPMPTYWRGGGAKE